VVEHGGQPVASVKTGTRAAARRAGLPGVTPHVLRHTAATWMVMRGVPIEEVARLLGHRDSRTTQRVYAKHSPDYLRRAVDALSA
jgi:integrase